MNQGVVCAVIEIGFTLIIMGLASLFWLIPWRSGKWETGLIIFAVKAALSLVGGGLIIIFLGVLYWMEIIPTIWWV